MTRKLEASPLGKNSSYITKYTAELLFPIPREGKRVEIGVPVLLPFHGGDIWNGYELSWLNKKGKPYVALMTCVFPCTSPMIIESKSFKLYLNSFNQTAFTGIEEVEAALKRDLSQAAGAPVEVSVHDCHELRKLSIQEFNGTCIDDLDITTDCYRVNPSLLSIESDEIVEENLVSQLLKSNCLVTGQPDWASLFISYKGRKINHEGLLKYIISFREHNEFHEQCIERIFMDISLACQPDTLTVYGRYTRRGGLDINPYRSTAEWTPDNFRQCRQ
jgi:7-cyano-7-deazaguanine reductase